MPGAATDRWDFTNPLGPDPVTQLRAGIDQLMAAVEAMGAQVDQGAASSRPTSTPGSPGVEGRFYYSTDSGAFDYDYGTGWVTINPSLAVDGPAGTGTLRTLGTGAQQAAAGNDSRLSNERVPTDDSVTAAKVNTSLKPSTGASGSTEALRAIGTSAGQVAAGDSHAFPGTLGATGLSTLSGGAIAPYRINAQTGTTYTLVLSDQQKLVTLSNASGITLTVPPNSSVAFPVGTVVEFIQLAAGQVTFAPGSGVTIAEYQSKTKLAGQYAGATLVKIATDSWVLVGNLA